MKNFAHSLLRTALAVLPVTLALAAPPPVSAASGGWGLGFDGTGGYVEHVASAIPAPWTATFWVKREDSPDSSAQLLNDSATALKLEQWPGTRKVGFTVFGVDDYLFNYSAPLATWTHLAFVGTTSNTTLYANGVAVDSVSISLNLPLARLGNTGDRLNGVVDEVAVWSRALSALEVRTNMNRLLPGPLADLAAYWRFNEGSGINVADTSGQGHGGTLTNGVSWVPSRAPDWPAISANVVGYVNLPLPRFTNSLIANPFNNGDNSVETILPLSDTSDVSASLFSPIFDLPFFLSSFWLAGGSQIIPPGEGFLIFPINEPIKVTLVGEVPEGHLVTPLPAASQIIYLSSKVPQARRIGAAGVAGTMQLPARDGDVVSILNSQQIFVDHTYDGFSWSPGDVNGPLIEVGQGFILTRGQGTALTWNRDFIVSSVTGPTLQIALVARSDGPVRITWTEPGWTLQQADDPEGPWAVVAGNPTSPHQFQPPLGTKMFYRLALVPPPLCMVDGREFGPSSPFYETMLISWPNPLFKLETTAILAANPGETVWSDLSTTLYNNFSPTNLGPIACGNSNGIYVSLDKRNRGISNSPAGPAEFSAILEATQSGVTNSAGRGSGTIRLTTTNGINYAVAVNIDFSDLSTNSINARIQGPPGAGGGTNIFILPIPGVKGTNGTVATTRALVDNAGGLGFTVAQQLEQLRSAQWFIAITTQNHVSGEIRGPLYLNQQFFRLAPR